MTTKKVLLALAATSLFAFGSVAPVWAEDPPAGDEGMTTEAPADPDSTGDAGDSMDDSGSDQGDAGMEGGESQE